MPVLTTSFSSGPRRAIRAAGGAAEGTTIAFTPAQVALLRELLDVRPEQDLSDGETFLQLLDTLLKGVKSDQQIVALSQRRPGEPNPLVADAQRRAARQKGGAR